MRTEESMNALKHTLLAQIGKYDIRENDIETYETFLRIFRSLFDSNCQIKRHSRKIHFTKIS